MTNETKKKILKTVGTVLILVGMALGGTVMAVSCGPSRLNTKTWRVTDTHDSTVVTTVLRNNK